VLPTSKLTAKMLQRRVQYQISVGAMGKRPIGTPMLLELITDQDTLFGMEQGNTDLASAWRFTDFGAAAAEYYKLGWQGKIGNYAVRVDLFPMRFQLTNGAGLTLSRKFPYKTETTTNGIRSVPDEEYEKSPYQMSFIHHRKAFVHLVHDMKPVNPAMPFLSRDLAGKWKFVMDNLGTVNGCVVDNRRRNKGLFYADYEFSTKAMYPDYEEAILHLREGVCTVAVPLCDTALLVRYNEQNENSANAQCNRVFVWTPDAIGGDYAVAANTILCNGQAITHLAASGANLTALLVSLNSVASSLGTWAFVSGSTTQIQLSTSGGCTSVNIVWV